MAENAKFRELTLTNVKDLNKPLGRGSYGRVFAVEYCGTPCAAKEIHSMLLPEQGGENYITKTFLHECYQCSILRHPNLVQFLGVYYPDTTGPSRGPPLPIMVMEMMKENLTNVFEKHENIPADVKWSILYDIALGLQYLHCHDPAVIHRDLSPNNVLLTSRMVAKIGDLGVAKVIKVDRRTVSRYTLAPGTIDFMPPEALENEPKYGTPLDVFSYAGIVLFVANQEWPRPTEVTYKDPNNPKALLARTEVERRHRYIDKLSNSGFEAVEPTIESCLSNEPVDRPSIVKVCEVVKELKDKHMKESPNTTMDLIAMYNEITKLKEKISEQAGEIETLQAKVDQYNEQEKKSCTEFATQTEQCIPTEASTQTDQPNDTVTSTVNSDEETDYAPREAFIEVSTKPEPLRRYGSLPAQSSQPSVRPTRSSTMPTNTLPINLLKSKNPTPLVTALQSGNHHIKWTKCADLPFAMSYASVVVDRQKEMIYVTPGSSTDATVYNKVFNLDMKTGGWNELPSPDHRFGILQIINKKLCIIGGSHVTTRKSIKKVSTYDEESKRWIQFYPDMLSPRFKPGVVTYGDHMVVLGGTKDNDNINDDIEVFNWRLAITQRNVQWQRSALTLPVPMWGISPTIVDEHLYIVGYTQPKGTSNRTYRLSINLLIFLLQQPQHTRALDRQAVWSELSRAPHFFTALVPELYPPIVVGGGDSRGDTATSDVCLYDISGNVWKKVASLPNARLNTAVATIDESTIIVFGGYTNGKTTQSAMDTCIATVEIGQAESTYYV